jgi:hypothetical protein
MNATLRKIAVSGGAAVALLGGATATASAATPEHEATVIAIARTDTNPGSNDLAPQGGVAPLQNPVTGQVPAGYNQQVQTQANGGVLATGGVAILLLGTIVFFRVKNKHLKAGDAVVVAFLGVALAGTVLGGMADQITDTGVASLGGILSGLG